MSDSDPIAPDADRPSPTSSPVEHRDGFAEDLAGDEAVAARLAALEMAGEEAAAGWKPAAHPPLAPEVRYLHISRTIHELITDRNRSVGIFLGVASLLFAASTALLNVDPGVRTIIPLAAIQYWCLPATFGTLAVIAVFISLLLIRARIGLIYEVTKLNVLLGLEGKRVDRVNPLSIFYLMHLMVVTLGATAAGFTAGMVAFDLGAGPGAAGAVGGLAGLAFLATFQALYYWTILRNTTEAKLALARP